MNMHLMRSGDIKVRQSYGWWGTVALIIAVAYFMMDAKPAVAAVPEGFTDSRVAQVDAPTAIAFTPDERMLVASRGGKLRVVRKDGTLIQSPALDISSKVCDNSERGLLGLAVDPKFSTNRYIYLYYTFDKHGVCPTGEPSNPKNPVNRVQRYRLSDSNTVSTDSVLIDNIPSPNGNHNAGDLHFGKDDNLYVSVGDGACDYLQPTRCQSQNDVSRDRNVLLGKILRITRDGEIPTDNPYTGGESARCNETGRTVAGKNCKETFAIGLRNPFRMAFDPNAAGTSFRINDVGGSYWEEVDQGKKGADYAWNICEGKHDNPFRNGSVNCGAAPYTPPIHDYSHNTGCSSITGAAFVPNEVWPSSYDTSYLFGDYVCGKIFKLTPKSGGGFSRTEFVSGLGRGGPVHMAFGPYGRNQALYYATYANGGEIRRVSHSNSKNGAPSATVTADPTFGSTLPLKVDFDGSKSIDPDSDPLTYMWDFGDGSKTETTSPLTTHEYASTGTYTATLKVRDSFGAVSLTEEVKIYPGNTPPAPAFEAPAPNFQFTVGENVRLSGSAIDAEGNGPIDLSWEIIQHHNGSHTHPYDSGVGSEIIIKAPPPEDLGAMNPNTNYLEARLTATDSTGLSKTISRRIQPKTTELTFSSDPSDLEIQVNGSSFSGSRTITTWVGYALNVDAPEQLGDDGRFHGQASWSDGGATSHRIISPSEPTSYKATFKLLPPKNTVLYLTPSRTLVKYGESVSLSGRLATSSGSVTGKTVELWRSTDRGRNWSRDGSVTYNANSRTYQASRKPIVNTAYQMRFAGDDAHVKSSSPSTAIRSQAYLSRPKMSSTNVKSKRAFTMQGYLKPYHAGNTRLSFFHYRDGKWRLHRTVYARNTSYQGVTKYRGRYDLSRTGRWYVKAYHYDASHVLTISTRRTFRVR